MSVLGESTPQRSSSLELSSPPHTPPHIDNTKTKALNALTSHPKTQISGTKSNETDTLTKRRKKTLDIHKDVQTDGTSGDAKPAKKPRVPRGQGVRALKKKRLEEEARLAAAAAASTASTNLANNGVLAAPKAAPHSSTSFGQSQSSAIPPANHPFLTMHVNSAKTGNNEAIHNSQSFQQNPKNLTTSEARPSSGQNYDPIRSSTIARHLSPPASIISTPPKSAPTLDAARSPSISSLIDPPDTTRPNTSFQPTSKRLNDDISFDSNDNKRLRLTPPEITATTVMPKPNPQDRADSNGMSFNQNTDSASSSTTLPIISTTRQPETVAVAASKKPTPGLSKGPSPSSTSPKPVVRKEAPALPAAGGSGLLTGSIFGAAGSLDESAPTKSAPTVVINVSLSGKEHHTINFTRLAEEKYGFDALHPRLAAQRDRLARVAAAGAALERAQKGAAGASVDDMSEDLSNDDGDNSNVEINGISGAKSGEEIDKPTRKKRIMKEDMYDIDDEFIDDTEQAWEEQAAVSKDGFFVYSGPLVPEGQEAKVERNTENPPKRATRGGRGSRGGGAGRGGRSAASKDPKDEKEVKRRVRRSKEQIERDRKEAEEKKAQKERQTILVSKPTAPFLPSQPMQMQFQANPMTH